MKAVATLVAAMMAITTAFAGDSSTAKPANGGKTWTINLGMAIPSGDHSDLGVDSMFMAGADYGMGMMGADGNTSSFIGVMWMGGSGDAGLDSRSWGAHYGVLIGMGNSAQTSNLKLKLAGGIYNTELSNGGSEDDWGFGGFAALVWMPQSSTGMNFTIEGGAYFMPEVVGVNNTGWYIAVGIPIKS
jgi:hypothetical protein